MKPMTEDQLRRHALATGSELHIDGRPFNTERAQVALPRAAAAPPPAAAERREAPPAAAPLTPSFTLADVEQMLADQEERFMRQLSTMLETIASLKENASEGLVPEGFTPKYDSDGAITFVGVTYARIQ
jgi:hypothetical protein